MQSHHIAWLSAHHDRTEEWLRRMLADGFDVHHLDGNHDNNDPGNLILIEACDHMRLHGIDARKVLRLRGGNRGGGRKPASSEAGLQCYYLRRDGHCWKSIANRVFGHSRSRLALSAAKQFARSAGKQWPGVSFSIRRLKQP